MASAYMHDVIAYVDRVSAYIDDASVHMDSVSVYMGRVSVYIYIRIHHLSTHTIWIQLVAVSRLPC